jgi:TetR/AcrR family transcriptional repressor of nem operon
VPKGHQTQTRDRLIQSGAGLFAEKGFGGVSVRAICKHAGTSVNMIHHYFESKEGLLKAITEQFDSNTFATPMRLLSKPAGSPADFRSRMEMLFEETLDAYIEQRPLITVVLREQEDLAALQEFMKRFVEFLEQAKKKGFVRKELDCEMITGFFLDRIVNQVQFAPWVKRNYGSDLLGDLQYKQRWCKANLDLLVNGMVP